MLYHHVLVRTGIYHFARSCPGVQDSRWFIAKDVCRDSDPCASYPSQPAGPITASSAHELTVAAHTCHWQFIAKDVCRDSDPCASYQPAGPYRPVEQPFKLRAASPSRRGSSVRVSPMWRWNCHRGRLRWSPGPGGVHLDRRCRRP